MQVIYSEISMTVDSKNIFIQIGGIPIANLLTSALKARCGGLHL